MMYIIRTSSYVSIQWKYLFALRVIDNTETSDKSLILLETCAFWLFWFPKFCELETLDCSEYLFILIYSVRKNIGVIYNRRFAMTTYVIGIDLGTTHSCVGVEQYGKVVIIANELGFKTTPSCVAFNSKEVLVGHPAKWQAAQNPENTIYDMKRLIGRNFDDETVQTDIKSWPFKVISDDGRPKVMVQRNNIDKILSPEDISAMILTKMKHTAEAYLDTSVKKAVITVPAFFSESQRKATLKAAQIAGLEVVRLVNEPTAAAIAYVTMKRISGTILVFDLGGGTLDVSIVTVTDMNCRVRATYGNTHFGGQDFTNNLLKHMMNICKNKYKKDITHNKSAIARLMRECEDAKTKLSFVSQVKIFVDCLVDGMDFCENITAAKFNEINSDLFNATLESVTGAIESAGLAKEEIAKVIMVGGSSRIPKLQSLLKHFFDKEVWTSINPDEAIAYGATVFAAAACSGVNITDRNDLTIQDIIPMSLGIGTHEGFKEYSVVIPKNSIIPISKIRRYGTHYDYQTKVTFPVFEGEAPHTKDNIFLDKFSICEVPPRPRGEEKFDVTFRIDMNGILRITAENVSTGTEVSITSTRRF
ncbi:putative heat shock 70 kDa protein cognate [Trypoxylus dichotomus]